MIESGFLLLVCLTVIRKLDKVPLMFFPPYSGDILELGKNGTVRRDLNHLGNLPGAPTSIVISFEGEG